MWVARALRGSAGACAVALCLDERGLVRPWRWQQHAVRDDVLLRLRFKARPPPIGCAEWPAGRVLLEWAVREVPMSGATLLEFGAGIGTTALGFALAARAQGGTTPSTVIATDVCEEALRNLSANAAANEISVLGASHGSSSPHEGKASVRVGTWDASDGEAAVRRLRSDFGWYAVSKVENAHVSRARWRAACALCLS
jgi:hypothetical protein